MIFQFPQLSGMVYGKRLIYLDNAATSMRPQSVIDKWNEMSVQTNANIHRSVHYTASAATEEFENARKKVSEFIGSPSSRHVVFTSGTTASINLVAFSFGECCVSEGDEIIVGECEHHSDIVPWQMLCQRKKAVLKVLPIDDSGHLRVDLLESMITDRTRLVCVAHISNVLGLVNPVKEITRICHSRGCAVLVDGAQGVVHLPIDVKDIGCDFYVFSGHKIYAAPGTGVLYAGGDWLDRLPPYMGGGEMIGTVKWERTTYADPPQKFEAGTQNLSAVPTWIPALETAEMLRSYEGRMSSIRDFLLEELPKIEGLRLYGNPSLPEEKIPLFSFTIDGLHHEDMALILDKMGIAVRSGQMCAEPLMDRFGVTGMLRVSFAPYNTLEDAVFFMESLRKSIEMLR